MSENTTRNHTRLMNVLILHVLLNNMLLQAWDTTPGTGEAMSSWRIGAGRSWQYNNICLCVHILPKLSETSSFKARYSLGFLNAEDVPLDL